MFKGEMSEIISRAAGEKTKGFRFQKIRAAIRLLERIATRPDARVYCAMEFLEDSVLIDEAAPHAVCAEENKFYSTPLTLNSKAIRNTLVAFLDLDAYYLHERSLGLAVFASATLGEENMSADVKERAGVTSDQPKYQILKKLAAGERLTDAEVAIAKVIVCDEFASQYPKDEKGRLDKLKAWTRLQFRDFLERIEWSITMDTNEELKTQALELVRTSPFFSYQHENLEVFILTSILDLLEERSQSALLIDKMVGAADIELLYLRCSAGRSEKPVDPAHLSGNLGDALDKRNIAEKIRAVSPHYSQRKLSTLQRRIGLAKYESQTFDREYVSLRHRVLDACEGELQKQAEVIALGIEPDSVDALLDQLTDKAEQRISSLSSAYKYRISDRETIRGAVLTLFEDCFLALNEASDANG